MKMQTRRHSHKSELAWKKTEEAQEVRYFFCADHAWVLGVYNHCAKWVQGDSSGLGLTYDWGTRHTQSIYCQELIDCPNAYLEVQASDLPYLEKPVGEWEFRKVVVGDSILTCRINGEQYIHGGLASNISEGLIASINVILSGYRWCAPRKVTCPHCNGTGEI